MKRITMIITGLALLTAGGCSTSQNADMQMYHTDVALTQFSPEQEAMFDGSGAIHLGAGDELGREIYIYYLASVHTEQDEYYATGSNPDPVED
jgi:hypothetical protein